MTLIEKFCLFVKHITKTANLITDKSIWVCLFFIPIFEESLIEGLAIYQDIVIQRVENIRIGLFGDSEAMIQRIIFCVIEIDRHSPK